MVIKDGDDDEDNADDDDDDGDDDDEDDDGKDNQDNLSKRRLFEQIAVSKIYISFLYKLCIILAYYWWS